MTCSAAHRKWCSADHEALVAEYRDARFAWEDLFEASTGETYRPGIIAEQREASRRGGRNEVTDFVESTPPITFRAWLEGNAGRNRDPWGE